MSDPFPLIIISIAYLYIVLKAGPAFMENRPAYNLKKTIQLYNVVQLAACIYVVYVLFANGWSDDIAVFKCTHVDYSNNERAINLLKICYFLFLIKIVEFLETIFFVLRKKQGQVSALHIYHHVSTAMFAWLVVKYVGGGMITFLHLLNTLVHILMYSYYLLSTFGPKWQSIMAPYKPFLTIVQMIQFCFMIGHLIVGLMPGCNVTPAIIIALIPNILINFYMFANFFKKSYLSINKKNN